MSDLLRGILIGVAIGGALSLVTAFTMVHALVEAHERWHFMLMALNDQWADFTEQMNSAWFRRDERSSKDGD